MAKKKKKQKQKSQPNKLVIVAALGFFALLVLPTSLLLLIGCLPTFVAFYVDKTPRKSLATSVAAMNLAGASLYLFKLWGGGHGLHLSLSLLSDPMTIVVMYGGAGLGYVIDLIVGGAVTEVMFLKAKKRKDSIDKEQAKLIKRWSKKVAKGTVAKQDN